jgi:phosphoglycerate dehydrogenase-like enzyme
MTTADHGDSARRSLRNVVITAPVSETVMDQLWRDHPGITFQVDHEPENAAGFPDADAIIGWRLTSEQLAQSPRLQWLQTTSAGVELVLTPEMLDRGVTITNASGVHAVSISEHLMAMMLSFARAIPHLLRNQVSHTWRDEHVRDTIFELHGQTLLIIGMGDIGIALADRAAGFGMRVLGVRQRLDLPEPTSFVQIAGVAELDSVLPEADHVAICLPLTERTRGLMSAAKINRMKRGAYIYNIGRGQIIDQDALIHALQNGPLGGAGLDVTDPEPLPEDSPLWDMPNVMITAHTSGSSPRYWERASIIIAENIRRWQTGELLLNEVDPVRGY